jgi:cysteinyl-tRNA synthetase
MSSALLGEHFDIHGGGQDLQFPAPRERDRAVRGRTGRPSSTTGCTTASCAWTTRRCPSRWATSSPSARCCSATTGGGALLHPARALPQPAQLLRCPSRRCQGRADAPVHGAEGGRVAPDRIDWEEPRAKRFREAMDDDFGTPEAVAVLFELPNEVNRGRRELGDAAARTGRRARHPAARGGSVPAARGRAAAWPMPKSRRASRRGWRRGRRRTCRADRIRDELRGGRHRAGGRSRGHDLAARVALSAAAGRRG